MKILEKIRQFIAVNRIKFTSTSCLKIKKSGGIQRTNLIDWGEK